MGPRRVWGLGVQEASIVYIALLNFPMLGSGDSLWEAQAGTARARTVGSSAFPSHIVILVSSIAGMNLPSYQPSTHPPSTSASFRQQAR